MGSRLRNLWRFRGWGRGMREGGGELHNDTTGWYNIESSERERKRAKKGGHKEKKKRLYAAREVKSQNPLGEGIGSRGGGPRIGGWHPRYLSGGKPGLAASVRLCSARAARVPSGMWWLGVLRGSPDNLPRFSLPWSLVVQICILGASTRTRIDCGLSPTSGLVNVSTQISTR